MRQIVLVLLCMSVGSSLFSQSKKVKKYLEKQDTEYREAFPPPLEHDFPRESLGYKLQHMYQNQAQDACGIKREGKRMYIPKEIISAYNEEKLRKQKIYSLPISAKNLLFTALTEKEIAEIKMGTYFNSHAIRAKHIIGSNDTLIYFGQSFLSSANGFPSFFFKKSCGSYFNSDLDLTVNAPLAIAELKSSLNTDNEQSSSITTITGKFTSPLYELFKENSTTSIYAHLLLWEIYYNQAKNATASEQLLIDSGKYISQFDGTLSKRISEKSDNINFDNLITSSIKYGIVGFDGKVKGGINHNTSFKLEDFDTSIHKLPNDHLNITTYRLPDVEAINTKLQNSLNWEKQSHFEEYATPHTPIQFSRILSGIPSSLCEGNSWYISDQGYQKNVWEQKPKVISTANQEQNTCICQVTGYLNKNAIETVINQRGILTLDLTLNHQKSIRDQKLSFSFSESVKVTDAPKILSIDENVVNAKRKETSINQKSFYQYPIEFTLDDTGKLLKQPYEISEVQLVNQNNENQVLILENPNPQNTGNNTFKLNLITIPDDHTLYDINGELTIPINIKFKIQLKNSSKIQLITNTLNIKVPNFTLKKEGISNESTNTIE